MASFVSDFNPGKDDFGGTGLRPGGGGGGSGGVGGGGGRGEEDGGRREPSNGIDFGGDGGKAGVLGYLSTCLSCTYYESECVFVCGVVFLIQYHRVK